VTGVVNYKKGCTRLAAASGKVYQLLGHGRWFSPDTSASSIIKTSRHDIAEKFAISFEIICPNLGQIISNEIAN
jgi:hypothetical protein